MIFFKIIIIGLSLFLLASFLYVLGCFGFKYKEGLYGLLNPNQFQKIVTTFAVFGFLFCIYGGVSNLLFWMPDSWGSYDEEGEWDTFSSTIAAICAFFSIGVLEIIFKLASDIVNEDYKFLLSNGYQKIISHSYPTYLETLLKNYNLEIEKNSEKIQALRKPILERRHGEKDNYEVYDLVQKNYVYHDLVKIIENNLGTNRSANGP